MNSTIVVALIIVAVAGLMVGATVANTASAAFCALGFRPVFTPHGAVCIPVKSHAPDTVGPP